MADHDDQTLGRLEEEDVLLTFQMNGGGYLEIETTGKLKISATCDPSTETFVMQCVRLYHGHQIVTFRSKKLPQMYLTGYGRELGYEVTGQPIVDEQGHLTSGSQWMQRQYQELFPESGQDSWVVLQHCSHDDITEDLYFIVRYSPQDQLQFLLSKAREDVKKYGAFSVNSLP